MFVTLPNLVSLDQLAQQTPAISRRMLVHWITSNLDGFRDRCALKIGRRVLLDEAEVKAWLSAHRHGAERPIEILT